MKKRAWIGFFLASVLSLTFLTGCTFKPEAGERPVETAAALKQVQTGTQGVELNFLPNYPAAEMYDTTEFVAITEVWNKGNNNLEPGRCFVHLIGYDKNIIRGMIPYQSCDMSSRGLEGKKVYNLGGSSNQIEFKSTNVMLPFGVFEYNPTLNLVACYNYMTTASPLVCVENSLHVIASEQKACLVKDVLTGGGQGAPVGISYVGVDMAGSKAIFEINVRNFDSGRVISPQAGLGNCPESLKYSDFDKVSYTVELSGGSLIDCKPTDGLVRLTNNQGKIACTFDVGNSPAYETPLVIRLNYNYMKSLKKPIKIIKTPGLE